MPLSKIIVLDFGSQYAHLIAKRFRALGYYSEIALPSASLSEIEGAKGIVLSGGPASVYDANVPAFNKSILDSDIPILGLCYGHQLMAQHYGGKVEKGEAGEFGIAYLAIDKNTAFPLFSGIASPMQVWMSHQDEVTKIAEGFEKTGSTENCNYAALQNLEKKRFSLQFHCEVADTPCGNAVFENFALFCGMEKNWDEKAVLEMIIADIQREAKDKNVLLFLSGGVDSSVTFALLNKALGQDRVLGLHIDNGFMRKDESKAVAEHYRAAGFTNFIVEDASERFLKAVSGLTDPQKKRVAVGETFIAVRDAIVAERHLDGESWMLAQGTLYPDIIESGGTKNSKVIKTHHNRVEGIQSLIEKGLIIEPLKNLYKDEVRNIGKKLGLAPSLIRRHPFPGPGLSINVLCSDGTMSEKDKTDFENAEKEIEVMRIPLSQTVTERYALPVRSVGVQGDFRTYRFPAVLSFETLADGFYRIPEDWDALEAASSHITNKASFINRTLIRLYRKPGVKLSLQKGYCDKERLDRLREADDIALEALHESGWYDKVFQHLTIDLPYASSPDRASFVLRPVCSEDVMTARFAHLPQDVLERIVQKIAALPFVDAVYYDATNKPPATFGWE
ncbi:GMP synthase (glutamine-hydrolyzing) domain-containing protein [Treponema socranskii subsp. paredis ATCC 35535]|nr:GMP synthase (glutamine-hydrolyzing) domain-containing protein [Treponema socranskii subsp. paredis ATCC 35535]